MAAILSSGSNSCLLALWVLQGGPTSYCLHPQLVHWRAVHCIQYSKSYLENPEPVTNLMVIMHYYKNVSSYSGPFVMMLYAWEYSHACSHLIFTLGYMHSN